MASSLLKYSYKAVEYTFVETPVQLLEELKCAICLELVSQPVSTSCQHLFCKNCIKDQHTCPTCRKEISGTTPDVGSSRLLKAFKVKCPNTEQGCEWEGPLGDVEEHLKRKKCQQQMVKCPNDCGERKKRELLRNHTKYNCPNRCYTCPHCDHVGVYKDITTVHFTNCRDFPLLCPAGCRKEITRRNMGSHLSTECPEEYVLCKFKMFGCDTAVRRREKESHFSDSDFHLQRLMELQVPLLQSLGTLFQSPTCTRPDVTSLPLSFRPWLQNTPTCYPRPPWVVKLEGFEEKRNNEEWFSNPVSSHFGGYKMCLRVYPIGFGNAKGTHVTVSISLMKGDNDDNLKFPFKGRIVISLLNQLEDQNHHTRELWSPEENNISEAASGRVTIGERSKYGRGQPRFIPHEDLNYNSDKNCLYLKNDCLFFRVDKFECVFKQEFYTFFT